jgi:hypothetical protein
MSLTVKHEIPYTGNIETEKKKLYQQFEDPYPNSQCRQKL